MLEGICSVLFSILVHESLHNFLALEEPFHNSLHIQTRLFGLLFVAAIDSMFSRHNQGIRQNIQQYCELSLDRTHHGFMVFELIFMYNKHRFAFLHKSKSNMIGARMHRIVVAIACAVIVFAAGFLSAESGSSIDKFKYQPDKIKVGTVYHYTKSGIDGTKPMTVSIYVDSRDGLQVFKTEPDYDDAAFIIADIDWGTFSASALRSMKLWKSDRRDLIATLAFQPKEKSYLVKIGDEEQSTAIPYFPVHVYNFDLITLNFVFRHLKDPKQTFKVGIADPDFTGKTLFLYEGEVTVEFVADENYKATQCRKYKISGPGLKNSGGYIWVDRDLGHFVNVEIPVPDNPEWKDFKFELKKIEVMTPDQWANYIAKNIGRQPY